MVKSPANTKQFVFHVIPNTHWDREWLYNFQETRLLLVEFMDKLLGIFDRFPDYKTYLLDSQTIPIEDYLEIRPEKKADIIKQVQEQRLFIGPWYTLPEEHLVNGESLVRNLLLGHRIASAFGGVMKVGYSPFSYGQTSQMPQIYQGFGIDTILFYHGIHPDESRSEFIFAGPDGSQLLASRMGSNARYNFFFDVYRPLVFGKTTGERCYDWHEQGLPFHLCSEARYQDHHFLLDPVKGFHLNELPELLKKFKNIEQQHCSTTHIACMQGMDSTQPDELELTTIAEAAKILTDDRIFHSSLPAWLEAVKASVTKDDLVVLTGERRTPRQLGTRVHLYGDVTSARTRLKRKNALAEQELQRQAEPFAAVAYLLGDDYPKSVLDLAWRYLLKCHPHDSIAGTGVDQIEQDMEYRLDQCRNIAAAVLRRALGSMQLQIDNANVTENQVMLTIFNPTPFPRTEVITAILDLPRTGGFQHYGIRDASTLEELEFQEACRYEHPAVVRHLGDATMEMPALRVHVHVPVKNVPALGYHSLLIEPKKTFSRPYGSLVPVMNTMENDYVKAEITLNGTVTLTNKETGMVFTGLHYFQDNGEAGHAWRHVPPAFDRVLTTLTSSPRIELLQSGPYLARYAVTHSLQLPANLVEGKGNYIRRIDADGDAAARSELYRELIIKSEFTLHQESRGLAVTTTFVNTCEDHRLRVMFPTRLAASHSNAGAAFDVVDRVIDRGPGNPWRHTWNPTHPHQRFVDVSDGSNGLAIINDGLREYEVTDDASRTIGITLVRAFEIALTTVSWRWERHPEMKGSQALGPHEFRYFIYPHPGDWASGKVTQQAEIFTTPLELAQAGPHPGHLPKSFSFLELTPSDLVLSCLKRAEDRDSIVVRVYNPTCINIAGQFILYKTPAEVRLLNLNEEPIPTDQPEIHNNTIRFEAKTKKIITMELIFSD